MPRISRSSFPPLPSSAVTAFLYFYVLFDSSLFYIIISLMITSFTNHLPMRRYLLIPQYRVFTRFRFTMDDIYYWHRLQYLLIGFTIAIILFHSLFILSKASSAVFISGSSYFPRLNCQYQFRPPLRFSTKVTPPLYRIFYFRLYNAWVIAILSFTIDYRCSMP